MRWSGKDGRRMRREAEGVGLLSLLTLLDDSLGSLLRVSPAVVRVSFVYPAARLEFVCPASVLVKLSIRRSRRPRSRADGNLVEPRVERAGMGHGHRLPTRRGSAETTSSVFASLAASQHRWSVQPARTALAPRSLVGKEGPCEMLGGLLHCCLPNTPLPSKDCLLPSSLP